MTSDSQQQPQQSWRERLSSLMPTNTTTTAAATPPQDYRGFSTSMAGSFQQVQHERVDACSVVCCGILQSDRDRFLLTKTRPPNLTKRILVHFMMPVCLLLLAMDCALHIPNAFWNQVCSSTLVLLMVAYFVYQCCKGRWKREKVRMNLMLRKHQQRHHNISLPSEDDEEAWEEALMNREHWNGQSWWDMTCAHSLLGCYPTDVVYLNQPPSDDSNSNEPSSSPPSTRPAYVPPNNLCGCLWNAFTMTCCGACGCYLQICGMCALAQEAREVEHSLKPPKVDYITFEPVLQYAQSLWDLRRQAEGNNNSITFVQHVTTLSLLSKRLLKHGSILVVLILIVWCLYDHWSHTLVALGTFLYACLLLFVVHYPRHRMDVSVDALIKYFVSGFVLATTLAISWELVVGLVVRFLMSIVMALSGVDVQVDNEYSAFWISSFSWPDIGFASISYRDYLEAFGRDNPVLYVIYLFINSYLVAALIEEVSKYMGYRMVDHVDVWTQSELDRLADAGIPGMDHDGDEQDEEQREAAAAAPSLPTGPIVAPQRSLKSIGAAMTVSMVAVAIGFSCLEDLMYIFIYNERNNVQTEISILVIRALLPVHPIAAAIQSIGVCQRDLEKDKTHQLGRILRPSILYHGTFDFVLLFTSFVTDNVAGSLIALFCALMITISGLVYFFHESLKQKERLERVDRMTSVDQSSLL